MILIPYVAFVKLKQEEEQELSTGEETGSLYGPDHEMTLKSTCCHDGMDAT